MQKTMKRISLQCKDDLRLWCLKETARNRVGGCKNACTAAACVHQLLTKYPAGLVNGIDFTDEKLSDTADKQPE